MKIRFLKAFEGDGIHLSFQDPEGQNRNILIDGGMPQTYTHPQNKGELKVLLNNLPMSEKIDILVITHVDNDHIGGICKWLQKNPMEAQTKIGKVWFNTGKLMANYLSEKPDESHIIEDTYITFNTLTGIGQGITVEEFLEQKQILVKTIIKSGQIIDQYGLKITILSPNNLKIRALYNKWEKESPKTTKTSPPESDYKNSLLSYTINDTFSEDTATHNGSSISFILNYKNQNFLFLADSHPSVIVEALKNMGYSQSNQLEVDFMKVSHHGSKANTNIELLQLVKTSNYVICTNGNSFNHPHKQLLARIIKINPTCTLYFNYPERINAIFSAEDRAAFPQFKAQAIPNNQLTY